MHREVRYGERLTPKFDAVEDIKQWFGKRKWNEISPQFAKVTDPRAFQFLAGMGGVQGFPVEAWYDLYHGEGAWAKVWAEIEEHGEDYDVEDAK